MLQDRIKEKIVYLSPGYCRQLHRQKIKKVQKFSSFFGLLAFCCLFFFAFATQADEQIISGFGQLVGLEESLPSASLGIVKFKPGEVVVKFKSEMAMSPQSETDVKNDDLLKSLDAQFPIQKIEPLLKTHKLKEQKEQKSTPQILEELKSEYPTRVAPEFPKQTPELGNLYKIMFKQENVDVLQLCELLKKNPKVEYAEPNYLVQTTGIPVGVPNDLLYSQQWALPKIKAPETWGYLNQLENPTGSGEIFLDQSSSGGSQRLSLPWGNWEERVSLSFSPVSSGQLEKIEAEIGTANFGVYTVFARLTDQSGQVLGEKAIRVGASCQESNCQKPGWVSFEFSPKFTLAAGQDYKIYLKQSPNWNSYYWKYNREGNKKNYRVYLSPLVQPASLTEVVLAVVDTGLDYNHEDLTQNIWINQSEISGNGLDDDNNGFIDDVYGWDFVNEDSDPMDENNHGTHVAGIVAAVTNNNKGISSLLTGSVKLMGVRFLDSDGGGWLSDGISAIHYAVENGATVINASWGGKGFSQALEDELSFAHNAGCVIVAAAGNDSANLDDNWFSPASSWEVISVAASDVNDKRASFSNYGAKVDVAAPGVNILSTVRNNSYEKKNGTSMAAPHVSGLAALIKSIRPNFNNEEVRQVIRSSATDILNSGWDIYSGFGRIDAEKAIKMEAVLTTKITSPAGIVRGTIEIKGIVNGANLAEYKLEYSRMDDLSSWQEVAKGFSSSPSERVFGSLDTSIWADGKYLVRLTANNRAGNTFSDFVVLNFDNIWISSPQNQLFRGGETMEIKGTAVGSLFQRYILEYANADQENPSWTKICEGNSPVSEGVLCRWNTSPISHTGSYQIKLTVYYTNGQQSTDSVVNIIDPTLHEGFPVSLLECPQNNIISCYDESIVLEDLNNDGKKEIIVPTAGSFWLLDGQGKTFPGWPKPNEFFNRRPIIASKAITADINLDGKKELIIPTPEKIAGYDLDASGNSTEVFQWSYPYPVGVVRLAAGDINNDTYPEIVVLIYMPMQSDPTYVFALDKNGNVLPGFPATFTIDYPFTRLENPAIADLDADGTAEIVIITSGGKLFVFDSHGKIPDKNNDGQPDWPQFFEENYGTQPLLADVDNDGKVEILVIDGQNQKLKAFKYDGMAMTSPWPLEIPYNGSLAAGFVSGNPQLDIFMTAGWSPNAPVWPGIFGINNSGQPLPGWPVALNSNSYDQPLIVDVNNDNQQEVIAVSPSDSTIYAFNKYGQKIDNWPKYLRGWSYASTPAFGDIDGDGKLEMVAGSVNGYIGAWDLETPVSNIADWPTFGHDNAHTGYFRQAIPVPTPTLAPNLTFTPTPIPTYNRPPTLTPTSTPTSVPIPTLVEVPGCRVGYRSCWIDATDGGACCSSYVCYAGRTSGYRECLSPICPGALSGTCQNGKVTLNWSDVAYEVGYRISRDGVEKPPLLVDNIITWADPDTLTLGTYIYNVDPKYRYSWNGYNYKSCPTMVTCSEPTVTPTPTPNLTPIPTSALFKRTSTR